MIQDSAVAEDKIASLKREGGWELTEMKQDGIDVALVPKGRTLLVFRDKGVTGTGGVNSFFGSCEIGEDGEIKFGGFGSTLKGGPRNLMNQEAKIIAVLGKATSYSIEGDRLTLSDESGDNCLVYVPKKKK